MMITWVNSAPIGWASSFGQLAMCIELCKMGADPTIINSAGNDALRDAQRERYHDIVTFFEAYNKALASEPAETATITDSSSTLSEDIVVICTSITVLIIVALCCCVLAHLFFKNREEERKHELKVAQLQVNGVAPPVPDQEQSV